MVGRGVGGGGSGPVAGVAENTQQRLHSKSQSLRAAFGFSFSDSTYSMQRPSALGDENLQRLKMYFHRRGDIAAKLSICVTTTMLPPSCIKRCLFPLPDFLPKTSQTSTNSQTERSRLSAVLVSVFFLGRRQKRLPWDWILPVPFRSVCFFFKFGRLILVRHCYSVRRVRLKSATLENGSMARGEGLA